MDHSAAKRIDTNAIVSAHWPAYKHDQARFDAAAEVAAKLVGYLHSHTRHGRKAHAIASAPDLARLLDHLGALAIELPRLLTQLATIAQQLREDPTLRDDREPDAGPDTADRLYEFLSQAYEDAVRLEMRLAQATARAEHLCHEPNGFGVAPAGRPLPGTGQDPGR